MMNGIRDLQAYTDSAKPEKTQMINWEQAYAAAICFLYRYTEVTSAKANSIKNLSKKN